MEKLTCPECGNAVASDATKCENCGCKITVCPDCGMVYKEGQMRCNECGRVLSEEALNAHIKEDAKKIEMRIDADKKRRKSLLLISYIIMLIGTFLFMSPLVIVDTIVNQKDVFERLDNIGTIIKLDKALACLGLTVFLLCESIMEQIVDLTETVKFCDWIREIKFDYREYIRTYGREKTDFGFKKEEQVYADKFSEAALLLENQREKLCFKLMHIFRFIVVIILIITGSCWIDKFFNQLLLTGGIIFNADIELEWANDAFYAFVIVLGIKIVIENVYNFIYHKHIKNKKQEILRSAKK